MRQAVLGGATASMLLLCAIGLPAQAPPATAKWVAKLTAPWPDADRLRTRRIASENRALFEGDQPIALTLTADFKTINKDRTPNSTQRHPAKLAIEGADGAPLAVKLRSRGHFRLHPLS